VPALRYQKRGKGSHSFETLWLSPQGPPTCSYHFLSTMLSHFRSKGLRMHSNLPKISVYIYTFHYVYMYIYISCIYIYISYICIYTVLYTYQINFNDDESSWIINVAQTCQRCFCFQPAATLLPSTLLGTATAFISRRSAFRARRITKDDSSSCHRHGLSGHGSYIAGINRPYTVPISTSTPKWDGLYWISNDQKSFMFWA